MPRAPPFGKRTGFLRPIPFLAMSYMFPQSGLRLQKIQDSLFSHSDCCGARMVPAGNDIFVCTNCRQPCTDEPFDR